MAAVNFEIKYSQKIRGKKVMACALIPYALCGISGRPNAEKNKQAGLEDVEKPGLSPDLVV